MESLHPLLINADKSLDYAYDMLFSSDIESSSLVQYVVNEVRFAITKNEGLSSIMRLNENTIKEILSSVETLTTLISNDMLEPYAEVQQKVFNEFNKPKERKEK